ncbi:hypothetical protein LK542_02540 [Massilia sp. IC2-477]|uniref:hypothetical protein n=1 Tax=Massilia sp. IC2-477 TaxID=2887198 RepID=UPI001D0FDEED|nr:hypothetical protein [Massilia sp. IC2-477]MCC2954489.1 hypothetical protein [Massilia sp. IC2-477]
MSYFVESRWGGSEDIPPVERMRELIAELDVKDEEHPDTWLTHNSSGWSIRLDEDHFAYFENEECEIIGHMANVSAAQALELWLCLAKDGPNAVSALKWIPGSRPISQQEIDERTVKANESLLASDRAFYDQLGPELTDAVCRMQDCERGRIRYSVFCKIHHFEQIRHRPCPFSD